MNLNGVKEKILRYAKKIIKYVLIKMIIPTLLVVILIAGICYYLNIDDGVKKKGDKTNASYVVSEYTGSVSIDSNGQLVSSMTAQELWDSMKENKNRALNYLSTSDELLKLMNAELVTQYLDTRNNPDEEIDWESINDVNSKNIQGIVKLKRADSDGNNYTMTYVDPETFQRYIDKYNSSGSEEDRNIALSHFTLSSMTTSGYDDQLATKIEEGDTIKIPSGFGSVHTYMGWQKITSVTSTQYKLREQAGMNFDSEGFGRINGRYVIACTTTYGNVGDYVDFYQEDGTIIPCIIGDIKNQNDAGCNKWGHENGHCIIEFVVNKDTWYNSGHANPGTQNCHPEWNKNLTKAVNGGSYFKNPNFGTETVTEKNAGIQDSEESENSQDLMKWPTDGTNITSEFGLRSQPTQGASTNHRGIDIGVPVGTNVYACESGKVTIASESQTAGNWVVIDHGNGYVSKYMHNSELKVSVGDQVEKGQVIALSGNTGISTGPHLHFQIEYQESPIDPMSFKYDNDMGTGSSGVGSGQSSDTATKYYAKVATWSETSTTIESNDPDVSSSKTNTYTMSSKDINYQDFLNGYKMPFEYLWALLVIGEDKDFVFDLADLVYGSDIEITVHDNLTINIDTEVNTYTKMKKTITDATVSVYYDNGMGPSASSSQSENWSDEEPTPCKVTETIIRKDNTLDISLTKADIWIAEYLQEYTYEKGDRTTVGENTEKLSNDDYPDINSPNFTTQGIDTYGHAQNLLNSKKKEYEENYERVSGSVNSVKERIYNATVDKEKYTKNEVETKMYISSPGKTMEKTDPNSEKDNFVTILLKKEHIGAKNKIIEVSSWLFEILETNESTADMLDLTKYLLYKATGKDYGVTEYDFSEYDGKSFTDISGDYGDWDGKGSNEDFIKAVAPYAVEDMQKHNIYASVTIAQAIIESGWGRDSIALNYNNYFGMKAKGEHTSGNEYWDGTGVLLEASEGEDSYFRVYDSLKNSIFDHGRNFSVTSVYKQNGVLECITKNLGPKEQLRRIAISGYAVNRDGSIAKPDGNRTYDVYLYEEFIKKYNLEQYDKMTVSDFGTSDGNQDIVKIAKTKLGCRYVWGAKGPNTFDCSGLVYWVYSQKGISVPGSTDGYKQYKNTSKEISWNEAQPGDILIIFDTERSVSSGHAGIYLGNDQYIHAPRTGDVVKISTGAKSKFKHVFRFSK